MLFGFKVRKGILGFAQKYTRRSSAEGELLWTPSVRRRRGPRQVDLSLILSSASDSEHFQAAATRHQMVSAKALLMGQPEARP